MHSITALVYTHVSYQGAEVAWVDDVLLVLAL